MRARSLPRSPRSSPLTEPRLTGESGGAGILSVICVLLVAAVALSGLAALNAATVESVRGRVSADLTALAGLNWGPAVAERVAEANGSEIVHFRTGVLEFEVTARVGRVEVSGRAGMAD